MKWNLFIVTVALLAVPGLALGRGFGRVGGFSYGGYRGGAAMGGYGGGYRGYSAGGYSGAYRSGGYAARGGSYTGPRGTTVTGGAAGGYRAGPYGAGAAGARGVRVTTPGGETYSRGSAGAARVGPYGGVSGGRAGYASGPRGTVAGGTRAGAAVGPYGGVAAYRGGVAVGRGGAVAVGHRSYYMSPYHMVSTGRVVRAGNYNAWGRGWYVNHPGAWVPRRWWGGSFWAVPVWGTFVPWLGYADTVSPIIYDYGSSPVFYEDNVYVDGSPTVSVTKYAEQAQSFADEGRDAMVPADDEFRALGSFGMVQGEEKTATDIFQLAINKAGVLRGNYYNSLTDTSAKVYGKLDKKSQRVVWTVGDKKDVVFEAGLHNLTKDVTTAVVHYGKEKTVQMMLVRLDKPKDDEK
jgi:hypothetical protein